MKIKYTLFACIIMVLASCSSAYRIGQTPDDVYYSPVPPQAEAYITSNNQQDKDSYGYNNNSNNNQEVPTGVYNSSNFSLGFGSGYNAYGYNPYNYNPYGYDSYGSYGSSFYDPYSFYSPYNSSITLSPFNYSNFFFPYYSNIYSGFYYPSQTYYAPVYSSKPSYTGYYRGPRQYNLNAYNNATRVAQQTTRTSVPVRSFSQQPQQTPVNGSGFGGFVRRIFTPSNNNANNNNINNTRSNNNDNNSSPVRNMNSSSGSSSGSSSSSGGSAPVRSFRH